MTHRVGVVGSFDFPEEAVVRNYIRRLPKDSTVKIVDDQGPATVAVDQARKEGFPVAQYIPRPDEPVTQKYTFLLSDLDWLVAYWSGATLDHVSLCVKACRDTHTPYVLFALNPETGELDAYSDVAALCLRMEEETN